MAARAAPNGFATAAVAMGSAAPRLPLTAAPRSCADPRATLPDELALEAIEQLCRSVENRMGSGLEPLLTDMLERPGGLDAFERLIPFWARARNSSIHGGALVHLVAGLPDAARMAVCRRLLAQVAAAPMSERVSLHKSPAGLAATLLSQTWPPQADVTEILDVALALGEEELSPEVNDHARMRLGDILGRKGGDPAPLLDRLVEARVAGYPGPWQALGHDADRLLDRAPRAALRRAAERALASDDDFTILWAGRHLLGDCYDRDLDGTPEARLGVLLADPARRALFVGDRRLALRTLPLLRPALRRGELPYPEAVATIQAIGTLHGGLANAEVTIRLVQMNRITPKELEIDRLCTQDQVFPFLGPPELQCPPVAAEWEALARARAEHVSDDLEESAKLWLRTLASGPWTAPERADLDAYFTLLRAGHTDELSFVLGSALAAKPDPELVPRFDEILKVCDGDTRPLMKTLRAAVRTKLGLETETSAAGRGEGNPGGEGGGQAGGEDDDDTDLPGGDWDDDDEEG